MGVLGPHEEALREDLLLKMVKTLCLRNNQVEETFISFENEKTLVKQLILFFAFSNCVEQATNEGNYVAVNLMKHTSTNLLDYINICPSLKKSVINDLYLHRRKLFKKEDSQMNKNLKKILEVCG